MKTSPLKLLFVLCIFTNIHSYSQAGISLSVSQDTKLLVTGDNRGNDAGTLDVLVRLKVSGKQKSLGRMVYVPGYERANLLIPYSRYSFDVGYAFNKIPNFFSKDPNDIMEKVEFTATLGFGKINRNTERNTRNWALTTQTTYALNKTIKLSLTSQLSDRSDISTMETDKLIRLSHFIGLEFNLFNYTGQHQTGQR